MATLIFTIGLVVSYLARVSYHAYGPCPLNEYRQPGGFECCPSCPPGWHVGKDCTERSITKCSRCPDGTFQGGHTDKKQCSNCTECEPGAGLKVKRLCSPTSDALCEPLDGFFCSDSNGGGCRAAQRHRVCSPGHYIGQRGTADKDTECLHCTDGTFSDGASSSCQPHKKCESVGQELMKPGTDSTDSECGEHGAHTGLVAGGVIAGVILVVVVALLFIAITLSKKKRVWWPSTLKSKRLSNDLSSRCTASSTSSSHSLNTTTSPEATPLMSRDSPAPTGDQQQPTTTTSAATMDGHDGDQSPGPALPSSPTHNGSVSITVDQEDDQPGLFGTDRGQGLCPTQSGARLVPPLCLVPPSPVPLPLPVHPPQSGAPLPLPLPLPVHPPQSGARLVPPLHDNV